MNKTGLYEDFLSECRKLFPVSKESAAEYSDKIPELLELMNKKMTNLRNINDLIGGNSLRVMYDNHKHHLIFLSNVFKLGFYDLMAQTLPWVYRAYLGHKFSPDYFPAALGIWKEVFRDVFSAKTSEEICNIYDWMISKHEDLILLSKDMSLLHPAVDNKWLETKNDFRSALLKGNISKCIEISDGFVKSQDDIPAFYQYIIQPAMYDIGVMWENDEISVAQEHLASSIVTRLLATITTRNLRNEKTKGKLLITSSPNEYHQIGAWMLSDVFELDGWDVRFLGADTPMNELFRLIEDFQPDVLALSVTMPFNIDKAAEIISAIKNDENMKKVK
ncbi:MAG: cobalamin B12-binding domain-containing protein, partial [Candidatus Delongbacteria bacterium]|nr:cobalamin B12-binding domain-containing protein [Candidatus Delongbacteria bacterium]